MNGVVRLLPWLAMCPADRISFTLVYSQLAERLEQLGFYREGGKVVY
jgi:hypothetical protein